MRPKSPYMLLKFINDSMAVSKAEASISPSLSRHKQEEKHLIPTGPRSVLNFPLGLSLHMDSSPSLTQPNSD